MTLGIMTLIIPAFSDTQRGIFIVILNVVVIICVVMLNAIMLNAVAHFFG